MSARESLFPARSQPIAGRRGGRMTSSRLGKSPVAGEPGGGATSPGSQTPRPQDSPSGNGPYADPPVFALTPGADGRPVISWGGRLHKDGMFDHAYFCDDAFEKLAWALGWRKP